ncbi:NlpC/P60 family protein [Streptomyces sp. NPDC088725]|uniref:C40 family peptidase n=1 Tax=Streptomyces sp. NPDC088725 TaxID=3365873 RepID=UPI00381182CF
MAAHRKRKQRLLAGPASRTAATLALAGAVTAAASSGPVQAGPRLTAAQVKAKVNTLYEQAEAATDKYDGAKEKADEARTALNALRDEAARRTDRLNASRNALGSIAAAQYRAGGLDPAIQLALSSSPEHFLEGAALAERAGSRQADTISGMRKELARISQLHTSADDRLADLKARQTELAAYKASIQKKLDAAKKLLSQLTAAQRARYAQEQAGGTVASRADRSLSRDALRAAEQAPAPGGGLRAPTSRAAAAVSFAYGALGKPYVWGATGPDSFDCSGLTQAAWRAAGVSLPRTSYTQINAGQRVSREQLAPGDLVFFYSGVSHVGIYVGGGRMIHAPRPGAPVRIAPIDQMPFVGAARPA